MSSLIPPTIKEHTELTLACYKKWDLVRYVVKLEKTINKAIKRLDKLSGSEIGKVIQLLKEINIERGE